MARVQRTVRGSRAASHARAARPAWIHAHGMPRPPSSPRRGGRALIARAARDMLAPRLLFVVLLTSSPRGDGRAMIAPFPPHPRIGVEASLGCLVAERRPGIDHPCGR